MAKASAAAMTPPAEDDDSAASGADASGSGADDTEQPEVIATILCYPDGSYGLTEGDENEDDAGGESDQGAEPEKFNSLAELMKGVMESVKTYEANKSGQGSEQDNFNKGFSGSDETAAPAQKY